METFNFPYHVITTKYPESSSKLAFGRGYEFVSKPRGPDQVTYILNFRAMFFFVNPATSGLDATINPTINMAKLEEFYQTHRLYEKFIYPHPSKGNLTVRFAKPLEFKGMEKGGGAVEPFTVELLHQP